MPNNNLVFPFAMYSTYDARYVKKEDAAISQFQFFNLTDDETALLLHFIGTDGSTGITDSSNSPKTCTAVGSAQIDTDQYKFGDSSLYLPAAGPDYITINDNAAFTFGQNSFCIDFWIRWQVGFTGYLYHHYQDASNYTLLEYKSNYQGTADGLLFTVVRGGVTLAEYFYEFTPAINTWYHISINRILNDINLSLDGIFTAFTTILTPINSLTDFTDLSGTVRIGEQLGAVHIAEYRVSNGNARWDSDFTPATNYYGWMVAGNIEAGSLSVGNFLKLGYTTAPSPQSGNALVYAKSDGHVYAKDAGGTEYDLTTGGGGSPDLWKTFTADSGSVAANSPTDSFDIEGGTGITTAISGDKVTITNSSPNVDQDLWKTIQSDSGNTTANSTTDTLTITGGTNCNTAIAGDTLTINVPSMGGDFSNGGDTAGANRTLGNNDAYSLGFETSGSVRIHITSGGQMAVNTTGTGITAGDALTVASGGSLMATIKLYDGTSSVSGFTFGDAAVPAGAGGLYYSHLNGRLEANIEGTYRSALSSTGLAVLKGQFTARESGDFGGAIIIGDASNTNNGTIRWTGADFEGRKGGAWVSLTASGGGGGDFSDGGEAGGADRSLGNTDNYALSFLTNNLARLVLTAGGDVYTEAWQSYATTEGGWSSVTQSYVKYKRIGKLVFVTFYISGTSNSTSTTFTVPYNAASISGLYGNFGGCLDYAVNNGVGLTGACRILLQKGGSTVSVYTNMYNGSWTNANTKTIQGSFWYEAA